MELNAQDTPEPETGLIAPQLPPFPNEPNKVERKRQTRTRTVSLPERYRDFFVTNFEILDSSDMDINIPDVLDFVNNVKLLIIFSYAF